MVQHSYYHVFLYIPPTYLLMCFNTCRFFLFFSSSHTITFHQRAHSRTGSFTFLACSYFTQTLTTLNLYSIQIGSEEVQHLANALQINKVSAILILISSAFAQFLHRQPPRYFLVTIESDRKEQNILLVLYRQTK